MTKKMSTCLWKRTPWKIYKHSQKHVLWVTNGVHHYYPSLKTYDGKHTVTDTEYLPKDVKSKVKAILLKEI